jgi:hypothetical protein
MKQFTKPINLNGTELTKELADAGVKIKGKILVDHDVIWIDMADKDEAKATPIVLSHDGTIVSKELTVEEKLDSVGLNLGDLKAALGL